MSQQEDVVGSKAEHEDQKNDNRQAYGPPFLNGLEITGQLVYDTDIAEHRDTERQQEENEHHAEQESYPGRHRREHVFLQHVKASDDAELWDFIGQVRGHERVQDTQDYTPHQKAADDSKWLSPFVLSEYHGLDNSQVAVNADGHHRQDRTVHVGVENQGQKAAHFGPQSPVVSL